MNAETTSGDWNAALYDHHFSCIAGYGRDLLPLLAAKPGESILDVGCGVGRLTAAIAAEGADVLGIDSSPNMIREARERYPRLAFECMDARHLTLDRTFDAVFSNAVLHWIPEQACVIDNIARVLRPGGRFVLEMGGKGNIAFLRRALDRALTEIGREDLAGFTPWYFPGIGEYASLLEAHQFKPTFAALFPRPTPLDATDDALRSWLEVFAGVYLDLLSAADRQEALRLTETHARRDLFHDGRWIADYMRLRIVAERLPDLETNE